MLVLVIHTTLAQHTPRPLLASLPPPHPSCVCDGACSTPGRQTGCRVPARVTCRPQCPSLSSPLDAVLARYRTACAVQPYGTRGSCVNTHSQPRHAHKHTGNTPPTCPVSCSCSSSARWNCTNTSRNPAASPHLTALNWARKLGNAWGRVITARTTVVSRCCSHWPSSMHAPGTELAAGSSSGGAMLCNLPRDLASRICPPSLPLDPPASAC